MNQANSVPGLPALGNASPDYAASPASALQDQGFAEELTLALEGQWDGAQAEKTGEEAAGAQPGVPDPGLQNMPPALPWLPLMAANFSNAPLPQAPQGAGAEPIDGAGTAQALTGAQAAASGPAAPALPAASTALAALADLPGPQVAGMAQGQAPEPQQAQARPASLAPSSASASQSTSPLPSPSTLPSASPGPVLTQAPSPSAPPLPTALPEPPPQVAAAQGQAGMPSPHTGDPVVPGSAGPTAASALGPAGTAPQAGLSENLATPSAGGAQAQAALQAGDGPQTQGAFNAMPQATGSTGATAAAASAATAVQAQAEQAAIPAPALGSAPPVQMASTTPGPDLLTAGQSGSAPPQAAGPALTQTAAPSTDAASAATAELATRTLNGATAQTPAPRTHAALDGQPAAPRLDLQAPVLSDTPVAAGGAPAEPLQPEALGVSALAPLEQGGGARPEPPAWSSSPVALATGTPTAAPVAPAQALPVVDVSLPIKPHMVSLEGGAVQVEVLRMAREGGGQITLELTPPDQGRYRLDLRIDELGRASLVVEGASESTRSRLEMGESSLREQFAQMGLQLNLQMRGQPGHDGAPTGRSAPLDVATELDGAAPTQGSGPMRRALALDLDRGLVRLYA